MTSRARSEHTSQQAGRGHDSARESVEGARGPQEAALERGLGLQRAIGNQAVIQRIRRRGGEGRVAPPAAIHRVAAAGVGGTSRPLPHLAAIQASFGKHDVSRVRAHTDATARAGTEAIGAAAYATGEHVAFSRAPDLFMAAHEAAHVVQQRAGVRLHGGVGEAGDRHERHADAVARLVVENKSAESLLDGHVGGGRRGGVQRSVQFWGEPDHYILGQTAGVKAREELEKHDLTDPDFKLKVYESGHGGLIPEADPSKPEVYEADDKDVRLSDKRDKFYVRGKDGSPISYGAANRFGGDFSPRPLGGATRGKSLNDWPAAAADKGSEYLDSFGEKGLMATNANHFYPLAGVEYRRQHQIAKQKMWMAVTLRKLANTKSVSEAGKMRDAAKVQAQQAIVVEGFASHFLADSFAAGHLAPHALGRIDAEDNPLKVGAKVNTWHDVFNALPEGIPTTLGRFHGDYSMDGHDLEYVSDVIANSLLEITMPWYAGQTFTPNIVLPDPDVPKIMADPVAGPLWRQMCGDYEPDLKRLRDLKRRKAKTGLSKYTIYQMTSDQQVSNAEAIDPILINVYGEGNGGLERRDDTDGDLGKIRGKVQAILVALEQILDYRGGWQTATGRTQKFGTTSKEEQTTYKFNPDLKSAQLAKRSPATSPIIPLIDELGHWLDAWRDHATDRQDVKLYVGLSPLLRLREEATADFGLLGVEAKMLRVRLRYLARLRKGLTALEDSGLEITPAAPIHQVDQGPDDPAFGEAASDAPIGVGLDLDELLHEHAGAALGSSQRLQDALNSLAADPRPTDETDFTVLYDLVEDAIITFKQDLVASAKAENPAKDELFEVADWCDKLLGKLPVWQAAGDAKLKRDETARREILADMVKVLDPYFRLDRKQLARATARVLEADE